MQRKADNRSFTSVDVPDLDAAVVEAGGQKQLVLAEREAVPLDVYAATLLLRHRGAESQAPDDVAAVDGVLGRLAGGRDHLPPEAVLTGQVPRAGGVGALLAMAHRAASKTGRTRGFSESLKSSCSFVISGACLANTVQNPRKFGSK